MIDVLKIVATILFSVGGIILAFYVICLPNILYVKYYYSIASDRKYWLMFGFPWYIVVASLILYFGGVRASW